MEHNATPMAEIQGEQPAEAGSSELAGKFKSGEQLEQAYKELEAEFTRRSQRLQQLARDNQVLQEQLREQPKADKDSEDNSTEPSEEFSVTVKDFLDRFPLAAEFAPQIADLIQEDTQLQSEQGLLQAYAQVLSQQYRTPLQMLSDDTLLQELILKDKRVRSGVLQDYLASLQGGSSPALISGGYGGFLPVSPKTSPTSLEQAAQLARNLFEN